MIYSHEDLKAFRPASYTHPSHMRKSFQDISLRLFWEPYTSDILTSNSHRMKESNCPFSALKSKF